MKFWISSTARGGVLWRLAKEQLTKDKKKAGREDRRQVMDGEFLTSPNFPIEQKPSGGCASTRAEQKLRC